MDKHKCNCKNSHKSSNGNGFLLGVIVGVIVALLFTTKKGREIVKELTEKGLDRFSDLQGVMNEAASDVKEAASGTVAAASELEEELVELVEDGSEGDYIAEVGTDPGLVAADSFGGSVSDESGIMNHESGQEKKVEKVKEHKKEEKASAESKRESIHHVKPESNGEAKSPKRFFLRRVRKS
jgi:gas vesicle protein